MQFQEKEHEEEMTAFIPGSVKPYGNPVIKVIGVGGGGSNAVNRMFKEKIIRFNISIDF